MRRNSWFERIIFSIIVTLVLSIYARVLHGAIFFQISIMDVLCGPGTNQIFAGVLVLTIIRPIDLWLIVTIIGYVCIYAPPWRPLAAPSTAAN